MAIEQSRQGQLHRALYLIRPNRQSIHMPYKHFVFYNSKCIKQMIFLQ